MLKQALDYATRNGYVQRNVAALVDRPGARSREMKCWTAEHAQRFLRAVENDPLYAAWVLFLARGPRRGEVAGLRWDAVDLDAGTLRIMRTRVSVGGRVEESEPKTAAGKRTLHLDAGLVAVLREHRKRQLAARLAAGPAGPSRATHSRARMAYRPTRSTSPTGSRCCARRRPCR